VRLDLAEELIRALLSDQADRALQLGPEQMTAAVKRQPAS
jgi:hypothetical protein